MSSKVKIEFINQVVETSRSKVIKEAVLFREISRVKIVLSLTYSNVYQNMYFLFQTKKTRVHKQKANEAKENRKTKETKKVKEKKKMPLLTAAVGNLTGCEFALCDFNLRDQPTKRNLRAPKINKLWKTFLCINLLCPQDKNQEMLMQ